MSLQLVAATLPLNCRITGCLRVVQNHGLLEEIEAIDILNSAGSGVDVVKDDEGLAFSFEVGLCDDLYNGAIFREDLLQGMLQLFDLDSLI